MLQESYELEHLNDGWGEEFRLHSYLVGQYNEQMRDKAGGWHHEAEMLAEQNELIRTIKERLNLKLQQSFIEETTAECDWPIDKSFQFSRENSTFMSSRSQLSDSRVRLRTDVSFDGSVRNHRRTFVTAGNMLERSLIEIEQHCSRETYELVRRILTNDQQKATRLKTLEGDLSKLQTEMVILRQRSEQQTKQCTMLEKRLQSTEAELSQKSKLHAQRQKQLTRMQTSLVVKQRMIAEQAKKLSSKVRTTVKMQMQLVRNKESKLSQQRSDLDKIWDEVVLRLDADCQSSQSFRKQVYTRCKESLLQQRKFLAQQQQTMEKEHQCISRIISQLKEHWTA